jgi:GNAT superfamily N-acetyltransferase
VPIRIRLGDTADVDAAVSVYERSNLARRHGVWPERAARVERVRARLRDSALWFLLAADASGVVAMAAVAPLRSDDGAGPVALGGCFLSYLFVAPDRWGEGIGGAVLDEALAESGRRHYSRIHLWTHEDNARSHGLYRSRGFSLTARTADGRGEWSREI